MEASPLTSWEEKGSSPSLLFQPQMLDEADGAISNGLELLRLGKPTSGPGTPGGPKGPSSPWRGKNEISDKGL